MAAHWGIDLGAFTSHNRYFVISGIVRPRMTLPGLYWPLLMALAVSLLSSYLPARAAARKITAETLRFA
jgi:ABC-type lipoprotein release transport system permease subunit